ncbi:MAG: TldD/PmbA family protein [Myxococcota bacterium]|nr:TldD/PmbA family protein [Myxococcota bacterium]
MTTVLADRFRSALPSGIDFCSLRYTEETTETITFRKGILQPLSESNDSGFMVIVHHDGGLGYAACADTSMTGIRQTIDKAKEWALRSKRNALFSTSDLNLQNPKGRYQTKVETSWSSLGLSEKLDMIQGVEKRLAIDPKIVDTSASIMSIRNRTTYLTSGGGEVFQSLEMLAPDMRAVANVGTETQIRSFGSRGMSQQGGVEILGRVGFFQAPEQISTEALQLLEAPDCPSGKMDLLLCADQMMLQIHESIGHPLEIDRILGDERNYAGTSFVTPDMFGSYQYGSSLLNVTFDPTIENEFATYLYDDHGSKAERRFLIRDGILVAGLGGAISQARSKIPGVANSRSSSWNRPPIDRMANLNVEPGDQTMDQLISSIERGVLMKTNNSWSIDDSRNKFQFGCEFGQYIENGQIQHIVKNPNYRGISESFWRNLRALGDRSTLEVLGTPYCGKGEPNQIIRVGHASPACLFSNVEVFGGA